MNDQPNPVNEQPKPERQYVVLRNIAPFISYTCLFGILLLPFSPYITRWELLSAAMILAHFASILNKIHKR